MIIEKIKLTEEAEEALKRLIQSLYLDIRSGSPSPAITTGIAFLVLHLGYEDLFNETFSELEEMFGKKLEERPGKNE